MKEAMRQLLEFHRAMCPEQIRDTPGVPDAGVARLRMDLMDEEMDEVADAIAMRDLPGIADGLADLVYVVVGTAVAYGIDLADVFDAVHEANMAKAGGPRLPGGKVGKPPGWTPPDVAAILARQQPLARLLAPEADPS